MQDPDYTKRCITFDGDRAGRMGDDPKKACSWLPNTPEHTAWHDAYRQGEYAQAMRKAKIQARSERVVDLPVKHG